MDIKGELKKARKEKKELEKKGLQEIVECGEKLQAMRNSPGWKYIEDYLTKEMETAMNGLLASKLERDIYYYQAVVTVIRNLLEKVGVSFQHASNAREILKKYK